MSFALEVATMTRRGGRNYNEDACGHWNSAAHLCCVLADGAGGHGGGDKASKLAVENILGRFAEAPAIRPEVMSQLVLESNRSIIRHRSDNREVQNMYSTVVTFALDLQSGRGLWAHSGDSRLYVFRGGRVATSTRDHSLVQSLVDSGMLAAAEMRSHPQRSELLSALGVDEEDLQIAVPPKAWEAQAGDVFLLCTDGLWEYVEEPQLESSLAAASDALAWLHELERGVLKGAAKKPRHDNFTAVAVWVAAA